MDSSPDPTAWQAPSATCLNHPGVAVGQACNRCRRPFCPDCLVPLRGELLCDACKHATLRGSFRVYPMQVGFPPPNSPYAGQGAPGAAPAPGAPGTLPPQTGPQASPLNPALAPEGAPPAPVGSAPLMTADGALRCSLHANNLAHETCERCGDFMCPLCSTCYEGRFYCLRCFDLLWQRGGLRGTGPQSASSEAPAALVLSIISGFCFFSGFNFILGFIAIWLGVGTLQKTGRDPTLPGRGQAIAALIISGLSMVAGVLFWLVIALR